MQTGQVVHRALSQPDLDNGRSGRKWIVHTDDDGSARLRNHKNVHHYQSSPQGGGPGLLGLLGLVPRSGIHVSKQNAS